MKLEGLPKEETPGFSRRIGKGQEENPDTGGQGACTRNWLEGEESGLEHAAALRENPSKKWQGQSMAGGHSELFP